MVVMVVDGVFPSIEESFLQHEQSEVVQEMEVEIARMTERRERLDWGLDFLPGIFGGDDRPAGVFDADTWEGQFQQLENYAHHDGNAELSKEEMEDFFFGEDGPDWAPGHGQEFYQDDAMSDAKYELWQRMGGGEEGSIDDLWDSFIRRKMIPPPHYTKSKFLTLDLRCTQRQIESVLQKVPGCIF